MKKHSLVLTVGLMMLGASSRLASADDIIVQNLSSLTVPQTRVYKTCLGAIGAQVFGSLAPGFSAMQTRTSPVLGACVWAREVGIEPYYISCFSYTDSLPDPSEPAQIIVTWTGTAASNLSCSIALN